MRFRPASSFLPAVALLLSIAVSASATTYPRLALYGSVSGNGQPYLTASGALDTTVIANVSRYDVVALEVSPITPYHPEVTAALRARNPNIKLMAYVLAQYVWYANDPDSLNNIPTLLWRTVRDVDGFLYDKNTGQQYNETNVNIAKRDANGNFVVVDALVNLFRDKILATGQWDGLFTDLSGRAILWTQQPPNKVLDYQRAGYATPEALEAAWNAAADTMAAKLRRIVGNGLLTGNGGLSEEHAWYGGWMREDFPLQGATPDWYWNMLADPHGVFSDEKRYQSPQASWLFALYGYPDGQQYTPGNCQQVRYGLASASLCDALHCYGPGDKRWTTVPYHNYWYDEYAVDLTTGQSSRLRKDTGWLGQPLGPYYQQIWVGSNPDAVSNSDFEASATTGWQFVHQNPTVATCTRDSTTSALGTSSSHIHITTPGTADWQIAYTTVGSIPMTWLQDYAVTFWCKSSTPRVIHVEAYAGGTSPNDFITVDNVWRQYQLVLHEQGTINAQLAFWLGTQAGDVWFDDVHFQPGATSVYRRDFQNGSVLVNPSLSTLTVPLRGQFRRILGTNDQVTNDGSLSTTATIRSKDGLFLISTGQDLFPPAPVWDLHVKP